MAAGLVVKLAGLNARLSADMVRRWAESPPEWVVADERTVKWDKEQTEYLRKNLASAGGGGKKKGPPGHLEIEDVDGYKLEGDANRHRATLRVNVSPADTVDHAVYLDAPAAEKLRDWLDEFLRAAS
jgi:hypothetical protein